MTAGRVAQGKLGYLRVITPREPVDVAAGDGGGRRRYTIRDGAVVDDIMTMMN